MRALLLAVSLSGCTIIYSPSNPRSIEAVRAIQPACVIACTNASANTDSEGSKINSSGSVSVQRNQSSELNESASNNFGGAKP